MDGYRRTTRGGTSSRSDAVVDLLDDDPRILDLVRDWWSGPFDYLFPLRHHSTRALHLPCRLLIVVGTLGMAACSVILLFSDRGPAGTARVWPLVLLVVQLSYIALVLFAPPPRSQKTARRAFVGSAAFCDVGLTSVLLLYSPVVGAVACALFALPSALCAFCVSARWMVAHLVWCATVILVCGWRVAEGGEFDGWAVAAGLVVLLLAVCLMPAATHIAWTLLCADARDSLRDPLTGLANRRGLWSAVRALWTEASTAGHHIAVIVVDVDDFKAVNDALGHDAGDLVLRELACVPETTLPPGAIAARTGGEELTLVAAGAHADLLAVIERLPGRFTRAVLATSVTVSVGAVLLAPPPRDAAIGATLRAAMRLADDLMYAAKRAGGDAVRMGGLR